METEKYPAGHTITIKFNNEIHLPKNDNELQLKQEGGKIIICVGDKSVDVSSLFK
jgi:hypothetical protein